MDLHPVHLFRMVVKEFVQFFNHASMSAFQLSNTHQCQEHSTRAFLWFPLICNGNNTSFSNYLNKYKNDQVIVVVIDTFTRTFWFIVFIETKDLNGEDRVILICPLVLTDDII